MSWYTLWLLLFAAKRKKKAPAAVASSGPGAATPVFPATAPHKPLDYSKFKGIGSDDDSDREQAAMQDLSGMPVSPA